MDFAGFCYEAVRVFLQMGRDAFFFCPDIWEGCQRRVLVRAFVRRVSRGFPGGTYHAIGMNFGKER